MGPEPMTGVFIKKGKVGHKARHANTEEDMKRHREKMTTSQEEKPGADHPSEPSRKDQKDQSLPTP